MSVTELMLVQSFAPASLVGRFSISTRIYTELISLWKTQAIFNEKSPKKVLHKSLLLYIIELSNKRKDGNTMKIQVHYIPQTEEIFVWGVWGQKAIEDALTRLNEEIKDINKKLRNLYE